MSYTDASPLAFPLLTPRTAELPLDDVPKERIAPLSRKALQRRARFQQAIAHVLARRSAARIGPVARPRVEAAREHVRFFMPKTSDGELLSLRCSEAEFSKHVGAGVALYMHFVKMTGYMFLTASVIVIPQIIGNVGGRRLHLNSPGSAACVAGDADGFGARLGQGLLFLLLSTMLGNASLESDDEHYFGTASTAGWLHLLSELLLCMMFCVYVYWIWHYNAKTLSRIDATGTRASDFAIRVSKLPQQYTDPHAVKAHFSFFGPIASVALSYDNEVQLQLLDRQQRLRAQYRRLHHQYNEAVRSNRGRQACARLLRRIDALLSRLLASRAELRAQLAAPCHCTGHAIVVFRKLADAGEPPSAQPGPHARRAHPARAHEACRAARRSALCTPLRAHSTARAVGRRRQC